MTRVVLLAATAMLLMAATVPSTASATYWRKCGDQPQAGAGWYRVKAHGIGCGGARAVARLYTNTMLFGTSFDETPYNFACQDFRGGIELSRVACRRQLGRHVQQVRFVYGA